MATHTIVTIVGSLRKESFSLKIANALAKLAPASLKLDVTTLESISFFNQDLEAAPPAEWLAFREKLQQSDGVLFVTPEYNRSIPGVLKNAIDVASRPYGKSSFLGKPVGIVSNSRARWVASPRPSICRTFCPAFAVRSSASQKSTSTASATPSTTRASSPRKRCRRCCSNISTPLPRSSRSRTGRQTHPRHCERSDLSPVALAKAEAIHSAA
jgi:hypothetical protein